MRITVLTILSMFCLVGGVAELAARRAEPPIDGGGE
jgi:predicted small integral membrane protein